MAEKALLAITTYGRPPYWAMCLAHLLNADTSGYEVWLMVDGGADPLNVEIARRTNEQHHVFDRIVECEEHLGCQLLRRRIFGEFRDGNWPALAHADDDLIYEPNIFADLLRDLRVVAKHEPAYQFMVGFHNRPANVAPNPFMTHAGREFHGIGHHGGALWLGSREGWLKLRPEPWSMPPFHTPAMPALIPTVWRAGFQMATRVKPRYVVQHLCNTHGHIMGWQTKWRAAFAMGDDGKPLFPDGFPMEEFCQTDEQFEHSPDGVVPFARKVVAALGGKVWLPDEWEYNGYPPYEEPPVGEQDPPPARRTDSIATIKTPDGKLVKAPVDVMITTPARSGMEHQRLAIRKQDWLRMYEGHGRYRLHLDGHPFCRYPDQVRTQEVRAFLESPCEVQVCIDNDVVPPPNALDIIDVMMAEDKDVVLAPTVMIVDGRLEWNAKRKHNEPGMYDLRYGKEIPELAGYDLVEGLDGMPLAMPKPFIEGIVPVDTIGWSCVFIRRCVYETIGTHVHQTVFDAWNNMVNTHDGRACEFIRSAGFQIWCHTGMRCEHWHGDLELTQLYDVIVRRLYAHNRVARPGDRIGRLPEPPGATKEMVEQRIIAERAKQQAAEQKPAPPRILVPAG